MLNDMLIFCINSHYQRWRECLSNVEKEEEHVWFCLFMAISIIKWVRFMSVGVEETVFCHFIMPITSDQGANCVKSAFYCGTIYSKKAALRLCKCYCLRKLSHFIGTYTTHQFPTLFLFLVQKAPFARIVLFLTKWLDLWDLFNTNWTPIKTLVIHTPLHKVKHLFYLFLHETTPNLHVIFPMSCI